MSMDSLEQMQPQYAYER